MAPDSPAFVVCDDKCRIVAVFAHWSDAKIFMAGETRLNLNVTGEDGLMKLISSVVDCPKIK